MQHNEPLLLMWKWSSFRISNDPVLREADCYNSKRRREAMNRSWGWNVVGGTRISQSQPLSFVFWNSQTREDKTESNSKQKTNRVQQMQYLKHLRWFVFTSCTLLHLSCVPSVCPLQLCNPSLCAPPLSCSRSWGLQEAAVCWHSWDVARSLIPTLGEIRLSCSPSCSCNFDQALMWLGSDPDMTGLATWKRSSEGRWGVVVERLDLTSKPREERNYSEGVFLLLLLCLVGNEGFMYSFFLGKYCDL